MAQRSDALVEGGVNTWPAYLVDLGFGIEWDRDGVVQLLFRLRNELRVKLAGACSQTLEPAVLSEMGRRIPR